ncbi:hypothetical protein SUNI508_07131 [Seiridium unicorne]|uniref:Uncharacterized protein n=1 Tax=Seiridium unicorne TaxID=138068 RepID=A0ABR2UYA3_9PEZI
METIAQGGALDAPFQDVVSFAFDKKKLYADEKPLYINADDPREFLSYARTLQFVRQLIAGFKASGLEEGDTVLVHLFNNYAYAPLFLSIVGAGGVFCATNPSLKSELGEIFELARPRFVVTTVDLLVKLQEWVPHIDLARVIILDTHQPTASGSEATGEVAGPAKSVSSLLCHGEKDWKRLEGEDVVKTNPASCFLTSGTTGCPKLAVLSHYSMVAHFSQIHQEVPYDVVRLGCLPLFHMFGGAWAMALTIRHGEPMYIMSKFEMEKYLEYAAKYKPTESFLAPPIVARLLELEPSSHSRLASLRFVGVGGAPITAETMRAFRSMLHNDATLSGVYGATEVGTVVMLQYGEEDTSGSVGRPLPGVTIALRPPQDASSSTCCEDANATGEVVISAQSHMMKYRNSAENINVNVEWYRTGDLGRLEGGKLYIVGKAKDIMKVNGFQVSPTEIEAVLLRHPDISECAVSKLVRNGAEFPRAYVVRRNRTLSEADVAEFSRCQLVSYKALTGGVVLVTQIPKLASGKIQRHRLEEMPLDTYKRDGASSYRRAWAWIVRAIQFLGNRKLADTTRNWAARLFHVGPAMAERVKKTV